MNIKDKITDVETFEKLPAVRNILYGSLTSNDRYCLPINVWMQHTSAAGALGAGTLGRNSRYLPRRMWWFVREYMRHQEAGGYGQALDALWADYHLCTFCPKPHAADPSKVEVFMDVESAIAERPMVTTLGRFLRKVSAVFSDEFLRDLDALHRADMSTELEILTTVDDIRMAYLEGPSSCMSKYFHDPSLCGTELQTRADHSEGTHPVDAYANVPGMGIAVTRDGSGRINSRCLVWQNPDDENDKRAVRVYGDNTLNRRLARRGFKFCGFAGAWIHAIPIPGYGKHLGLSEGINAYAVPYIDGVEGSRGDPRSASYLVKYKGDDKLWFINNDHRTKLVNFFRTTKPELVGHVTTSGSPEGVGTVIEIDRAELRVKCGLTGREYEYDDPAVKGMVTVLRSDGTTAVAVGTEEVFTMFPSQVTYWSGTATEGAWSAAHVAEDTPGFVHRGRRYLEAPLVRTKLGYAQLSQDFYPGSTEWHAPGIALGGPSHVVQLYDGRYIKREDAIFVVRGAPDAPPHMAPIHKSQLASTGYQKVHSRKAGEVLYADKATTDIRKTDTGRMVVMGFHDVVELYDGRIVFTRRAAEVQYIYPAYSLLVDRSLLANAQRLAVFPRLTRETDVRKHAVTAILDDFEYDKAQSFRYTRHEPGTDMETMLFASACARLSRVWADRRADNGAIVVREGGYSKRWQDVPNMAEKLSMLAAIVTDGPDRIQGPVAPAGYKTAYHNMVIEFMAVFKEARRQAIECGLLDTRHSNPELIDSLLDTKPPAAPAVPATTDETLAAIAPVLAETADALVSLEGVIAEAAEAALDAA